MDCHCIQCSFPSDITTSTLGGWTSAIVLHCTVPAGVKRYTFSPDAAYAKELKALANDEVPEPPCGEWGEMPDGIQY